MILDNPAQIKSLDKSNMLGSIENLANQCREAWQDLKGVSLPSYYSKVKNIVVAGMGGSAIGSHIIKSIFADELKISLEVVNDYHLPAYVNKDSLVILSSYSGSTEETVSCAKSAQKIGCRLLVMTAGKDLADLKQAKKIPGYLFNPHFNPCNSPRMGLGYSLFGLFILLGKAKLIKFGDAEAEQALKIVEKNNKNFSVKKVLANNSAKELAEKLMGKIPFYFASNHLAGSIHTAANQLNENAKVFGGWFLLSECNHHLMEGLIFPKGLGEKLVFVFFPSASDETRMRKRFVLTQEAAQKSGIEVINHPLAEKTKIGQVFELLVLCSYVSFYLAMLYNIDPTPIPMVDWFKKKMG